MITEQERVVGERNDLINEIKIRENRIKQAEKYERLKDNEDFKSVIEDIKLLIENHRDQIKGALHELADAYDPNVRIKWSNFIADHVIEMELKEQAVGAVDAIVRLAKKSSEELPDLRERLEEIKLIKTSEEK